MSILQRMHGQYYSAAPPSKDPATISMVVENWAEGQYEQFSPVHRINGFPWRLRIYKGSPGTHSRLEVYCDKSNESELWECEARFTYSKTRESSWNVFKSWSESGQMARFWLASNFEVGFRLEVSISTSDDGNTWRSRPTLDPLEPLDGILVFGEEKKKIRVSKKSLASLSHYFDALFNGNFQERNMNEIPIGDVEYEEFLNIIKIVYGFAGASVTDENMIRLLLLADRFELKVVEDKVVSYILSSSCSLSIHEKLLISDQFNHTFLKERLISTYTKSQLIALSDSPEWAELSENMTRDIVKRCCKLTG